jgi:tetratricopeptide (TPR) repeat protein
MVPYERNPFFTGRDAFLKQLFDKFRDKSTARYHGRLALYGLGGIGKTQVALEFVYRYQSAYTRIYWISAVSHESILDGYAKIAKQAAIEIPFDSKPIEIAARVLSWLRQTQKWLLVFDNLDDIDVLSTRNLNLPNVIEMLLPQSGVQQHTLITTRNRHADSIPAQAVEVLLFDKSEAMDLLVSFSNISVSSDPTELDSAETIVHELGYLPLAIVQAAAYIKEVTQDYESFFKRYHAQRSDIHKWIPQGLRSYPYSVATTWLMSFEVVRTRSTGGAELFQLLSFLNPDGVRIDFLQSGVEALQNDVRQLLCNQSDMAKALIELEKFSLLKWNRRRQTLLIHRLVQAVVKDEMSNEYLTMFRAMIIDLCYRAFPTQWDNFNDRRICQDCVGQVMIPLLDSGPVHTETAAHVMSRVGEFLRAEGKFRDSEQFAIRAFRILTELHAQDKDTLRSMNNLALTYSGQGKMAEAAALQEEVLRKSKQILPSNEDLETLRNMSNLALTYRDQGNLEAATRLQEEVLKKRKEILGNDHVDTLWSMNNLAVTYQDQGKTGEATILKEEVVQKSKRILGPDHLTTLTSMNNLAVTYQDQGKLGEAAALQEEILQKMKQILGHDHPTTLTSTNNLALTYQHQGRMEEAAALQEEVLQKQKQILGHDHPTTLKSMHNLASIYALQGKIQAATLEEEVLQRMKQILGSDHPATLMSMHNLAGIYRAQRKLEEAATLEEKALQKRRQVLGNDHPHTLTSMDNLAVIYQKQGKLAEAAALEEEVLPKMKEILGNQHPDTLWTMDNLASIYRVQGRTQEVLEASYEIARQRND